MFQPRRASLDFGRNRTLPSYKRPYQPEKTEGTMSQVKSGQVSNAESGSEKLSALDDRAMTKSRLAILAAWIDESNIPFLITSVGMIVMLLWAGLYKMTAPGAEGIFPLVSNSPLTSWQFELFGTYIGSDLIGL